MILSFLQIFMSFYVGFALAHFFIYKLMTRGFFAGDNFFSQFFNTKG